MTSKKKVMILAGIIIVAIVWIVVFGVGKSWSQTKTGSQKSEESYEANAESTVEENLKKSLYQAPIYKTNENVTQDDWSFKINEVEWTKTQGDWPYPGKDWYQTDETGKLEDNKTLIKVNLTVERIAESEDKKDEVFWLNSLQLQFLDNKGNDLFESTEVCSASGVDIKKKNSFETKVLHTGDCITTDIIYSVEDTTLKKSGYCFLDVNMTGMDASQLNPDEHCYIQIPIEDISK